MATRTSGTPSPSRSTSSERCAGSLSTGVQATCTKGSTRCNGDLRGTGWLTTIRQPGRERRHPRRRCTSFFEAAKEAAVAAPPFSKHQGGGQPEGDHGGDGGGGQFGGATGLDHSAGEHEQRPEQDGQGVTGDPADPRLKKSMEANSPAALKRYRSFRELRKRIRWVSSSARRPLLSGICGASTNSSQ